jgi:hypothetical protein
MQQRCFPESGRVLGHELRAHARANPLKAPSNGRELLQFAARRSRNRRWLHNSAGHALLPGLCSGCKHRKRTLVRVSNAW